MPCRSLGFFALVSILLAHHVSAYQKCRNVIATRVSPNPLITGSLIGLTYPPASPPTSPELIWPTFFPLSTNGWLKNIKPNAPFPNIPLKSQAVGTFSSEYVMGVYWGYTQDFLTFTMSPQNGGLLPIYWSTGQPINYSGTIKNVTSGDFYFDPTNKAVWMFFRVNPNSSTKYTVVDTNGVPLNPLVTAGQVTLASKWDPVKAQFIINEFETPNANEKLRVVYAGIAPFYFRNFQLNGVFYALSKIPGTGGSGGSYLMQSITGQVQGPYGVVKTVLDPGSRHTSVVVDGKSINVAYSNQNASPETIYMNIVDTKGVTDANSWDFDNAPVYTLLYPQEPWEGALLPPPNPADQNGDAPVQINGLRDPGLFYDDKKNFRVAYAGGGEYALGIATLKCDQKQSRKMA